MTYDVHHSMPLCILCKHYHAHKKGYRDEEGNRHSYCDAYPEGHGIPEVVYWTEHFKSKPDDNGIQFEAREDVEESLIQRYRELFL